MFDGFSVVAEQPDVMHECIENGRKHGIECINGRPSLRRERRLLTIGEGKAKQSTAKNRRAKRRER